MNWLLAKGKAVPEIEGSSLWKLDFVLIPLNAGQNLRVGGLLPENPFVDIRLRHTYLLTGAQTFIGQTVHLGVEFPDVVEGRDALKAWGHCMKVRRDPIPL